MLNSDNFIGRARELDIFKGKLDRPGCGPRILYIRGPGGIGKTCLIQKMLQMAQDHPTVVALKPDELIDFYSIDYISIDAVQERIARLLGSNGAFAGYNADRSLQAFRHDLQELASHCTTVLAFDTFEVVAEQIVGEWLIGEDPFRQLNIAGISGLICLIGSRTKLQNESILPLELGGFELEEALKLYNQCQGESPHYSETSDDVVLIEELKGLLQVTNHPLLLQLTFNLFPNYDIWSRFVRFGENQRDETVELERYLMEKVHEDGEVGNLSLDPNQDRLSVEGYNTIVCMSYLDRRFDARFLRYLAESGYVHLNGRNPEEVLHELSSYYLIKQRQGDVLQLHDEFARIVHDHLFPKWQLSTDIGHRAQLPSDVIRWYDDLISTNEGNMPGSDDCVSTRNLKAEHLYYTLRADLRRGRERFLVLAAEHDRDLNKLLVAEIGPLVDSFPIDEQFDLYMILAEMETDASHYLQGEAYGKRAFTVAERLGNTDQCVLALLRQHNSTWQLNPRRALNSFLDPALSICEHAPGLLARVQYEMGFIHRHLQDINGAINWYERAKDSYFKQHIDDDELIATIRNDLGYAYAMVGRHQDAETQIKQALKIRRTILARIEARDLAMEESVMSEAKALLRNARSEAAVQVGMTLNTLGEVMRFRGNESLEHAEYRYGEALQVFVGENDYRWQAKCLAARGETRRRLALERFYDGNKHGSYDWTEQAKSDLEISLKLCEVHLISEEMDTSHRRMGRWFHDQALVLAQQPDSVALAQDHLVEARKHFEQGYNVARNTNDILEELENLTELAFLADDWIRIVQQKAPPEFVSRLGEALDRHRGDYDRVFVFPVFENLYKIELAACSRLEANYDEALQLYTEGFSGLACAIGYGTARYTQHLNHLQSVIEALPSSEAIRWCRTIIIRWETTSLDRTPQQSLSEAYPDLVVWCKERLLELESDF